MRQRRLPIHKICADYHLLPKSLNFENTIFSPSQFDKEKGFRVSQKPFFDIRKYDNLSTTLPLVLRRQLLAVSFTTRRQDGIAQVEPHRGVHRVNLAT